MLGVLDRPRAELLAEKQALESAYEAFCAMGLKLDMSRGKPAPEQLDLSLGLLQETDYLGKHGVDARNYGNLEGMPEAREFFAPLLGVKPDETIVGGNSSLHLMYLALDMALRRGMPGGSGPWEKCPTRKFICPVPGYDRHFRITQEFGFEMISVPMGEGGPDMDEVERLALDPDVKGIWCIPLYSNPDGYVYSDDTVRRLAGMKTGAPDFRLFWDNAYSVHHLFDDAQGKVLNIMDECRAANNENRPMVFFSTSKITFAGGGVAACGTAADNLAALLKHMFPMTISFDKMNQLRHVRFFERNGGIPAHMRRHAQFLRPKFAIVEEGFTAQLAAYRDVTRWTSPLGGYFVSLYVMPGCAKRVVELCAGAGVVLTGAGAAFPKGHDPQDTHLRIAPTYPTLAELKTSVELLCTAVKLATIEKVLSSQA